MIHVHYFLQVLKIVWALLARGCRCLYSPSCREGSFSETQRLSGRKKGRGVENPGPLEHVMQQDFLTGLAYSSQASMFTCRTTLPSRTSSVVAASTRTPSGYSHASLNATRSSLTTSFSTRCVIARPHTSLRCSVISSLPRSTCGELGVVLRLTMSFSASSA